MMVGPEHQATSIPAFRPLPAQPSASEARFLHLQPLFTPVDEEETDEKGKVTKTRAARAGVTVPMPPLGVAASSADFRWGVVCAAQAQPASQAHCSQLKSV
jgi:hypothetical protein